MVKPNKLSRELFVNMITNLILEGEIYFLLFNLTSSWMEGPLHKLLKIMFNLNILENELPIDKLNINPEMQFDINIRNQFKKAPVKPNEIKIVQAYSGEPYA